ncbi:helix-turn-helix domain-containing protein [Mucilaginibacter ximonensis]|uniref:Helix-turn-helix domain-containing protein n=1 Tax=Mucilaginibacter ximonensis TaxID=538021 RepID=A0ABW5Y9M2_9SPHI
MERRKGKNIEQFINKAAGESGTEKRERFESDLSMEVLQELIVAARKKKNLSQEELAALIGVKKARISQLEKGYGNATIATIAKVSKALDLPIRITVKLNGRQWELC